MGNSYVGGMSGGRAGSTSTLNVNFALTGGINSTPQPGDLVVIAITTGSTADRAVSVVSPTGYEGPSELYQDDTYDVNLGVSYKFMGDTPDTSFQLPSTGSANDAQRYTVHVFRGIDPDTPLTIVPAGGINGRTVNPGAVTPDVPGSWIYVVGAGAGATGGSYTASYLTAFLPGTTSDTNDAFMGAGYYPSWESGSYDPAAFGGGGTTTTSDSWAAFTIVLPPAPFVAGSVGVSDAAAGSFLYDEITPVSELTVAGWFYMEDLVGSSFPTMIAFTPDGASYYWLGLNSGAIVPWTAGAGFGSGVGSPSAGQWVYGALKLNATTLTAYAKIGAGASVESSISVSSISVAAVRLLQDWSNADHLGAHCAYVRKWNAYLSKAELDAESASPTAIVTTGLISDDPLTDTSTLGSWTANGTLTDGPVCPYVEVSGTIDLAAAGTAQAAGAAGLLKEVSLAGSGLAVSTGTAGAKLSVPLTAVGVVVAAGSAGLQLTISMAAAGLAQALGNAGMALAKQLAATGQGAAAGSAALQVDTGTSVDLAAAGAAAAAGTATLSLVVYMGAQALAQAGGSAAMAVAKLLGGAGQGAATGGASLAKTVNPAAAGQARAAGGAALWLSIPLDAQALAQASGTGQLRIVIDLNAQALVQAIGAGQLHVAMQLQADGQAQASGMAGLQVFSGLDGVVGIPVPSTPRLWRAARARRSWTQLQQRRWTPQTNTRNFICARVGRRWTA